VRLRGRLSCGPCHKPGGSCGGTAHARHGCGVWEGQPREKELAGRVGRAGKCHTPPPPPQTHPTRKNTAGLPPKGGKVTPTLDFRLGAATKGSRALGAGDMGGMWWWCVRGGGGGGGGGGRGGRRGLGREHGLVGLGRVLERFLPSPHSRECRPHAPHSLPHSPVCIATTKGMRPNDATSMGVGCNPATVVARPHGHFHLVAAAHGVVGHVRRRGAVGAADTTTALHRRIRRGCCGRCCCCGIGTRCAWRRRRKHGLPAPWVRSMVCGGSSFHGGGCGSGGPVHVPAPTARWAGLSCMQRFVGNAPAAPPGLHALHVRASGRLRNRSHETAACCPVGYTHSPPPPPQTHTFLAPAAFPALKTARVRIPRRCADVGHRRRGGGGAGRKGCVWV
jgi:hypothetical protein